MPKRINKSEILTRVLCMLCAIILWVYVLYTENPTTDMWINNVNVQLVGLESLTKNNLILLNGDNQKVSVKLRGRRNSFNGVDSSKVKAVADLGNITATGDFYPDITVSTDVEGISVAEKVQLQTPIVIDKIIEHNFDVELSLRGGMPAYYVEKERIINPKIVTASGPATILKGLKVVTDKIDVTTLNDNSTFDVNVHLMDAAGVEVKNDMVKMNTNTVNVKYVKAAQKHVNINALLYGNNENFDVKVASVTPDKTTLEGSWATLENTDSISTAPIDITNFAKDTTITIPVNIPNGLISIEGVSKVEVTVSVSPKVQQTPIVSPQATIEPVVQ